MLKKKSNSFQMYVLKFTTYCEYPSHNINVISGIRSPVSVIIYVLLLQKCILNRLFLLCWLRIYFILPGRLNGHFFKELFNKVYTTVLRKTLKTNKTVLNFVKLFNEKILEWYIWTFFSLSNGKQQKLLWITVQETTSEKCWYAFHE